MIYHLELKAQVTHIFEKYGYRRKLNSNKALFFAVLPLIQVLFSPFLMLYEKELHPSYLFLAQYGARKKDGPTHQSLQKHIPSIGWDSQEQEYLFELIYQQNM